MLDVKNRALDLIYRAERACAARKLDGRSYAALANGELLLFNPTLQKLIVETHGRGALPLTDVLLHTQLMALDQFPNLWARLNYEKQHPGYWEESQIKQAEDSIKYIERKVQESR